MIPVPETVQDFINEVYRVRTGRNAQSWISIARGLAQGNEVDPVAMYYHYLTEVEVKLSFHKKRQSAEGLSREEEETREMLTELMTRIEEYQPEIREFHYNEDGTLDEAAMRKDDWRTVAETMQELFGEEEERKYKPIMLWL